MMSLAPVSAILRVVVRADVPAAAAAAAAAASRVRAAAEPLLSENVEPFNPLRAPWDR